MLIAVTKIASARASGAGMRPKGRVRKAGQSPAASRRSRGLPFGSSGTEASPSSRTTTLSTARRSPRWMHSTTPAAGATKRIAGAPRSVKSV